VVLADASTLLQRLRAGGMHVRLALAVLDGVGDGEHDLMQRLDRSFLRCSLKRAAKSWITLETTV
jgi:hypothetical protein